MIYNIFTCVMLATMVLFLVLGTKIGLKDTKFEKEELALKFLFKSYFVNIYGILSIGTMWLGMYLGGRMEVDYLLVDVLILTAIMLAVSALLSLGLIKLGKYQVVEGVLVSALLAIFIRGYVLPLLESVPFQISNALVLWSINSVITLFIVGIVSVIVAFRKDIFRGISIFVIIFAAALGLMNIKVESLSTESKFEESFTFAKEGNVILLVMESFQGVTLDTLAKSSDVLEPFTGFDVYTAGVTSHPVTAFSTSTILTGRKYLDDIEVGREIGDYSVKVLDIVMQDSLFSDLQESHDRSMVGWVNGMFGREDVLVSTVPVPFWIIHYYEMFSFSCSRLIGYNIQRDALPYFHFYMRDSVKLMNRASESVSVKDVDPKFLFMFDFSMYQYLNFNREGKEVDIKEFSEYSDQLNIHKDTMYFSLSNVGEFLNALKRAGVYDSSLIIIVGDHGRRVFNFDDSIKYAEYGEILDTLVSLDDSDSFFTVSSYNPAVMIKAPYSTGDAVVTHDNIWTGDLRHLANYYIGGGTESVPEVINRLRLENPEIPLVGARKSDFVASTFTRKKELHLPFTVRSLADVSGVLATIE